MRRIYEEPRKQNKLLFSLSLSLSLSFVCARATVWLMLSLSLSQFLVEDAFPPGGFARKVEQQRQRSCLNTPLPISSSIHSSGAARNKPTVFSRLFFLLSCFHYRRLFSPCIFVGVFYLFLSNTHSLAPGTLKRTSGRKMDLGGLEMSPPSLQTTGSIKSPLPLANTLKGEKWCTFVLVSTGSGLKKNLSKVENTVMLSTGTNVLQEANTLKGLGIYLPEQALFPYQSFTLKGEEGSDPLLLIIFLPFVWSKHIFFVKTLQN